MTTLTAIVATIAVIGIPRLLAGSSATDPAGEAGALDSYHPGDAVFFSHFRLSGGAVDEVEHYATVEQAVRSASAVVTAEVLDVRQTRVVVGEVSDDRIHMIGVVLRPIEVLSGMLPAKHRAELTVEFMAGSVDPRRSIEDLKSALPTGRSVWFLRAKAEGVATAESWLKSQHKKPSADQLRAWEAERDLYRVVSSQGLFIQGKDHVINPIADPTSVTTGMVAPAQRNETLSGFVRDIRAVR